MSLTSYRAAPPRATMCRNFLHVFRSPCLHVGICLRECEGFRVLSNGKGRLRGPLIPLAGHFRKEKMLVTDTAFCDVHITCPWQTWQRLTLPRLETKYHQRWSVSRPSSEWDRVQPLRHNHQVGKRHVIEKLF